MGLTLILTGLSQSFERDLSPYSTGNGVRVGYPTRMKSTEKNETYMANARNLCLGPNATYIPLTRVRGFALGDVKNLRHLMQKISTCLYR